MRFFLKKTNITQIVISGERLSNEVIDKLREIDKDVQFYNVYGLTENSPRVCALVPSDFFNSPNRFVPVKRSFIIRTFQREFIIIKVVSTGHLGRSLRSIVSPIVSFGNY